MKVFDAQYEIVQTEVQGEFSKTNPPQWFLALQHTTLNAQGTRETHPVMLLSQETALRLVETLQAGLTAMQSPPESPPGSAVH